MTLLSSELVARETATGRASHLHARRLVAHNKRPLSPLLASLHPSLLHSFRPTPIPTMPVPIKLEPIGPEPMSTSTSTTTAASAPTSCLFRGGAAKLLLDSPFPLSEIRPPPFASAGRAASATPSFGAPAQTPSTTPIGGRWPSSSAQPSEARSSLFPVGKPSGASMFALPGVSVSQDKAQDKEKHGGQSERYSHTHIPK